MAYEVEANLRAQVVAHKDLEVRIKTRVDGQSASLGTLLISKGNLEWLPSGNSVNKFRVDWEKLAKLITKHGKPVRIAKKQSKS